MVPVKWDIKQPSQPWITVSYIDRKFFPQGQDFPNDLNHMAPYRPPHTPNFSHLSLPGIADVAPGQSNSVTRDANKDLEGDGQHGRPKTP
ncbi:hypothetical protein H0H93_008490 [Arthromyces matolae]|nr:hypothetical protein H0H93_008490 [Arthromyces matolae]